MTFLIWSLAFLIGIGVGYFLRYRETVGEEPHTWDYSLVSYIREHAEWSFKTFGPSTGHDAERLCRHIEKELQEIRDNPLDCEEWVDVIILAIDGALRSGHFPIVIANTLQWKQKKNMERTWSIPEDLRTPIEHHRMEERETNP
jgi:hypothetical protein